MGSPTLASPVSVSRRFFCINPRTNFTEIIHSKNPQIFRPRLQLSSRKRSPRAFLVSCGASVYEKVKRLDLEFRSLSEPIDRVKRLLHYANLLVPFEESSRTRENRVMGCGAQVWLEVEMDQNGLMRYRVDSDSEIAKGFCSCLIWLLDGAGPEEVLRVSSEDLVEMNVGLPSRGKSRVNSWQNVLICMQKRTRDLVEERDLMKDRCLEEALSSLLVVNGNCKETPVH